MSNYCRTIEIIGEGITEKAYVESIRDIIKYRPRKIHQASSIAEIERCIKSCVARGVTDVLCLIDMDNKIADGQHDHDINAEKYHVLKAQYHNRILTNSKKESSHIVFIESYPSIEIFFLYYGQYTTAAKTNEGLKSELKDMYGYEVSAKYFNKHSLHEVVFSCNGGCLKNAINNSRKSAKNRCIDNKHAAYSEMHTLFDILEVYEQQV